MGVDSAHMGGVGVDDGIHSMGGAGLWCLVADICVWNLLIGKA